MSGRRIQPKLKRQFKGCVKSSLKACGMQKIGVGKHACHHQRGQKKVRENIREEG